MPNISLASTVLLAALTLPIAACDEPVVDQGPVDDAPPLVEGLVPAEDLDPAVHVVRYELNIGVSDVKLAGQPVQMFTYNGMVPGPLLQARVGDDVTIVVTNQLTEATSVHWHGIRVPNEMDGVVHGEMKAIEPGESFTYRFTVPDAATFWFHPHIRTNVQIERGLHGMFVVHEANDDAPDVDADRAFVLDDVLLNDDGTIAPFATTGPDIMHGRQGNVLLTNGTDDVEELTFAPGQVERWRLLNTANARTMVVRFPGLVVRQIGADGGLWPQGFCRTVEQVTLPVGGRAEIEVRLADGATAAQMVSAVLSLNASNDVVEVELPLRTIALDTSLRASSRTGHTRDWHPDAVPTGDITHSIAISGVNNAGVIDFTLNGQSWPDFEEWKVPLDSVQIIEIHNQLGMEHPFHLHGHFFQVVSRTGRAMDDRDRGPRDTVLVRGQEKVRIAVRFDNPGMWMYHCHNLEHEENGMMAMVEVEGAEPMAAH